MKKETLMMIGLCMILLGISGFLFWRGQSQSAYTEEALVTAVPREASQSPAGDSGRDEQDTRGEECAVYVSGAVKNPGIYRYRGRARVCDAVEAVGGFRKNAAEDAVNLARALEDGEQINIPTKKEAARQERSSGRASDDSGAAGDASSGKININTATEAELMELPGIGQAKATLIINYRKEHGNFSKIQDLMQISGIKEGIFQKIKDQITTS